MAQGKNFSLQGCPNSKEVWHEEKKGNEKGKHGSGSLHTTALQYSPASTRTDFLVGKDSRSGHLHPQANSDPSDRVRTRSEPSRHPDLA